MKKPVVPFVDLSSQHSASKRSLLTGYRRVLEGGMFILGKEVETLERETARFLGVRFSIGVASGTDAIELALRALNVGKGEVIVPANAYPSVFGVIASGCTPKIVDIDRERLTLDEGKVKETVSGSTKAILAVHLFGKNMLSPSLVKFARAKGLFVIEDCAQAFSGSVGGRNLGTFGDISCFSFYPTKPLGGLGDGGMVCTNSRRLASRTRELRMYGERKRYESLRYGCNSRLDEVQAAFLRAKLPHVIRWRDERRRIHRLYERLLSNVAQVRLVSGEEKGEISAAHLCVILARNRDKLRRYLLKKGIMTQIHYPATLDQLPYLKRFAANGRAPVARKIGKQLLSLPLYNGLKPRQIKFVTSAIRRFYGKKG